MAWTGGNYWGDFQDAQKAHIARWLCNSEAGWLFYAADGEAYSLSEQEARQLEAEANSLVDRFVENGARQIYPDVIVDMKKMALTAELKRWQAEQAERLDRLGRGGVPADIARRNRRSNPFRAIVPIALLGGMGHAAWLSIGRPRGQSSLEPIDLILIVVAFLALVLANAVDAADRYAK